MTRTDSPEVSLSVVRAVVRSARPRHWVKNVLVLAAPALSGRIGEGPVLVASAVAFVCFCLAASGTYLVNDARDVEADRAHPVKRRRPVAAGELSTRTALAMGGVLIAAALLVATACGWPLVLVVATYAAISLAYCLGLKNEPLIDIVAIASGFILRAVAGGVASGIPLSEWFILATSFGSLFMAAGKRYAEINDRSIVRGSTRASLATYSPTYIRFVWTLSAGVLITTYGLWAFDRRTDLDSVLPVLSVFPFVVAVLRYAMHVDGGAAGEPEDIIASDRWLQALGLVWVVLVAWPLVL
jgi:decaprenyl-phosphate phosphoribosyltransferase